MSAPRLSMTMPQARRHEVVAGGLVVRLPAGAHRLLTILMLRRGRCVTYEEMVDIMWPDPDEQPLTAMSIIDQYLSHLRARLGFNVVDMFFGVGLRLSTPATPPERMTL